MKAVLIGGSGFLGRALRSRLVESGHDVVVIGRGSSRDHDGWREVSWDATTVGPWAGELDGADVLVHLAGKRVDARPTRRNIDALIASREGTVRLVGKALADAASAPTAWVQLSSLAAFGDAGDAIITEDSSLPTDGPRQQVEVCRRWEAAFHDVTADIPRTVLLRPAITIGGAGDPASEQLLRLARLGLGGKVGSGRQWVSWIGADDMFDLLERATVDPTMQGLYHLTAPTPVTNAEMMAAYRATAGRRFGLPSPTPITKVGAWLLGSDPALALTGRRCIPQRLTDEGYTFRQLSFSEAVADIAIP